MTRLIPAVTLAIMLGGTTGFADETTSTVVSPANIAASLAASDGYRHGVLAAHFVEVGTGREVLTLNAEKSVVPASCMKAVTTAASLSALGAEHRFRTDVVASGTVRGAALAGDLVIRGGGDPTFGSDRVPGSLSMDSVLDRITSALLEVGIREVTGDVIGDDSFLPWDPVPDGWEWEDIGNYYGAGTSGLCFHDNLFLLRFRPGNPGQPAPINDTIPSIPGGSWTNEVLTGPPGSGDNASIFGAPGSPVRLVRGTVPAGDTFTIRGALPYPALACADMVAQRLRAAGIVVAGTPRCTRAVTPEGGRVLVKFDSPPLGDIITTINKQSFNLYAEMMLMHTSAKLGDGSRASGLRATHEWLRRMDVPLGGWRIRDGSGLSRGNNVTAAGMASFAAAVTRTPVFDAWSRSLPVLGVDGDLAGRETTSPLRGRVRAKTGLISGARGLVGILERRDGSLVAFALFANQYSKPWTEVDRDFDALLRAVFEERRPTSPRA